MSKTVAVDDDVHEELYALKGKLIEMGKRAVTMSDVLRILLKMPEEEK